MPCVHRTKIFLTINVIDRQTNTKHNNIEKVIYKHGQKKVIYKHGQKKDKRENET